MSPASSYFKSDYYQGNYFISLQCCLNFRKGLTDAGSECAAERWLGTEATSCPRECVVRLSQGFVSILPSLDFGFYPFSPVHKNRKEKAGDWQWRGSKNFHISLTNSNFPKSMPVFDDCSCLSPKYSRSCVAGDPVMGQLVMPSSWLTVFKLRS